MLAFAAAINAGNLGPAAGAMATDLDVSLATVGFVGGTIFFAGLVVAKLGAARYVEAVGTATGVRTCCFAGIAGNLIIAASPMISGVAAGRLVTGISPRPDARPRPGSGAPCRRRQARRRVRRGGHDRDGRGPRRRKLDAIGRARLAARFRPRGGDQPAGPAGAAGGGRSRDQRRQRVRPRPPIVARCRRPGGSSSCS